MKKLLLAAILILNVLIFSQTFTGIDTGFPAINSGNSDWGDYDNDGDLDLLLYGNSKITLYRNDTGTFIDANADFVTGNCVSAEWGDYDNDGDLDIALCYYQSPDDFTVVYRNENGIFTDINAGLDGAFNYIVDWGDHDNDGDLDLLLSKEHYLYVYVNEKGTFSGIATEIGGFNVTWGIGSVYFSPYAFWIDHDSDGDLDICTKAEGVRNFV